MTTLHLSNVPARLHRSSVSRRIAWPALTLAFAFFSALGGCGLVPAAPDKTDVELARFYMPYAAMAARVYHTEGRTNELLGRAASSSWLRKEIASGISPDRQSSLLMTLNDARSREEIYRTRVGRQCAGSLIGSTLAADDSAVRAAEGRCRVLQDGVEMQEASEEGKSEDSEQAADIGQIPTDWKQCQYTGGKQRPRLPLTKMTTGWEEVPELQRSVHPKDWSIFVPGLAIDVWRQRRAPQGEAPVVEYALVFRGTTGGGGWVSNLRAITAFTPRVWDQYNQALIATTDLINQIYQLHALSDALFDREENTRIQITAVGHSLGGGLASYVYLRVPQITRVVSFDPSPINGSSLISPKELSEKELRKGKHDRASVMRVRRQPADRPTFDNTANIFVLYERGEILTRLAGCSSGAMWGSEGGPNVRCDAMNLSGGSPLKQHNMPQLACKLYLVSEGIRTRD